MHQIRYFLSLSRTLNFTRAAEGCNVTQPSLTRAIKLLGHELGGDLLRRERGPAHLTELGRRMLPLLTQRHASAVSARSVAQALRARKCAALRLALPHCVSLAPFAPHLTGLLREFVGLALKLPRAAAPFARARLARKPFAFARHPKPAAASQPDAGRGSPPQSCASGWPAWNARRSTVRLASR